MYLSAFQKVQSISREKVKTIRDFLLEFKLINPVTVVFDSTIYGERIVIKGSSDFFFNQDYYRIIDRESAYTKLIDFKKVINLLSKAELIEIEQSANLGFGYTITTDHPVDIISLIDSSQNSFIITYNEINKFAKDYLTPQERSQKRQLWVPIIVAISTVILSAIINYFIYSKEREVTIKNVDKFKDSLYVKILNDRDSLSLFTRKEKLIDSLNKK